MKVIKCIIAVVVITVICVVGFKVAKRGGSSKEMKLSENVSSICELTTLRCYYHNVAAYSESTKFLVFPTGVKKVWITYSGIVNVGIEANELVISQPDKKGVVHVTMPKAKVLSVPLDETTIDEQYVEGSLNEQITIEDKTLALAQAQRYLEEAAAADTSILQQGQKHAQLVIQRFIINLGEEKGEKYTVVFDIIE